MYTARSFALGSCAGSAVTAAGIREIAIDSVTHFRIPATETRVAILAFDLARGQPL